MHRPSLFCRVIVSPLPRLVNCFSGEFLRFFLSFPYIFRPFEGRHAQVRKRMCHLYPATVSRMTFRGTSRGRSVAKRTAANRQTLRTEGPHPSGAAPPRFFFGVLSSLTPAERRDRFRCRGASSAHRPRSGGPHGRSCRTSGRRCGARTR